LLHVDGDGHCVERRAHAAAPVLKARAKLLVLLSPVMSIGVGIVTP
jgi:hypothetical protein